MDLSNNPVIRLRAQIASLEGILADLKTQLADAETYNKQTASAQVNNTGHLQTQAPSYPPAQRVDYAEKAFESSIDLLRLPQEDRTGRSWELTPEEHKRYGRQLIMPEIGLRGQLRLKNGSVLIVGVGGLGCPAATYLAGAGVGKIGLMDGDKVELSNLHRQLLHTEKWLGLEKVDSAVESLMDRNSEIHYVAHNYNLDQNTAVEIMENYDLILDCTDRPSTRYLVSDAAVLAGKPIVTASALRTEGQLMVLNSPPRSYDNPGGFCYRCVFPKPPPKETVLSCGEGGILGPVVGVMGVLMAMEALKILAPSYRENEYQYPTEASCDPTPPSLLLYSAYSNPPFRSVKLRGKRKECPSCSDTASITEESLKSASVNYSTFCASTSAAAPTSRNRISAKEYSKVRQAPASPHLLVDVREKVQFDICHLRGSINLPYSEFSRDPVVFIDMLDHTVNGNPDIADGVSLYLICRYGNDSQLAADRFMELERFRPRAKYDFKGDVAGGLRAWREEVDAGFPEY
ncbi:MAG: Urmylation protein [Alectoria sarmentosa]|nr:MAG: Urmylation protein [Alectoria sarmentosa]